MTGNLGAIPPKKAAFVWGRGLFAHGQRGIQELNRRACRIFHSSGSGGSHRMREDSEKI